jgi:glycosyltransferase involved in cell wall biosynthesis
VEDGETGRLCPVGDVAAMTDAALEVLSDPRRGREMGQAGRAVAIDRYSVDRIVPLYENFYREVADR